MKTIIAGSRDATIENFNSGMLLCQFLSSITEVVSGKAPGIDTYGELWAITNSIPVTPFPAEWDNFELDIVVRKVNRYGKEYNAAAGTVRNRLMASYADALVLIYDGSSKGSTDMLSLAKKNNLVIFVYNYTLKKVE